MISSSNAVDTSVESLDDTVVAHTNPELRSMAVRMRVSPPEHAGGVTGPTRSMLM